MSSFPSTGQFSNFRPGMNGGPSPYQQNHPSGPNNAWKTPNNNKNYPMASDMDPHYSNPYIEQQQQMRLNGSNVQDDKMAVHRPRINRKNAQEEKSKSSLTTNFDPMKDRHMWAMWRTAVNGRIVDQVRKNEQFKQDALLPPDEFSSIAGESDTKTVSTYGKDLASAPPLSRFIRLNQKSKNIAQELMNEGQGQLETSQFIYYGLPRVTVNTNHNDRYNKDRNNYNFDPAQNGHSNIGNGFGNMNAYNGGPHNHPVQDY